MEDDSSEENSTGASSGIGPHDGKVLKIYLKLESTDASDKTESTESEFMNPREKNSQGHQQHKLTSLNQITSPMKQVQEPCTQRTTAGGFALMTLYYQIYVKKNLPLFFFFFN